MPGKKLVDPRDLPKQPPDEESEQRRAGEETPETTSDDEEIDAWPTHEQLEEEGDEKALEESGLSVEPEDLARAWLIQATEQGNFESSKDESDSGIHIINIPTKT